MLIIDNIGELNKCRIWLNEIPMNECEIIQVLSSFLEVPSCMSKKNQSIAIELFVAPRYYALLGIEYVYKKIEMLEVYVNVAEDSDKIIIDKLALPSDKVHWGISNEYAQTIIDTSLKVSRNLSNVPSGVLTFNIGGYSDYGSNKVIFSKVTSILVRLLVSIHNMVEIEDLKNVVRKEMAKPLAEV